MTTKAMKTKTTDEGTPEVFRPHARLIKHFIASHGRFGRSFLEIYTWGDTLADEMISGFGFTSRAAFEAMREFALSLERDGPRGRSA